MYKRQQHHNVPNTISNLSGAMADHGINIEDMQSKSKKDYAYTIVDVSNEVSDEIVPYLKKLPGIINVRVIKG